MRKNIIPLSKKGSDMQLMSMETLKLILGLVIGMLFIMYLINIVLRYKGS